ncbi:MAG: rhomboid family intramembrane serine protease, partial [Oscillospiraceae bacterium]|nr:rhomboid family intramembrane serine protease [Oscillospiraceae bacterium]
MPRNKFILRRPFPYVYRRTALSIIFINFVIFGLGFLYPNLNEYVHYYGAMNPILVVKGHMYWQFISYMFVHQNISHVFFNMLALLV